MAWWPEYIDRMFAIAEKEGLVNKFGSFPISVFVRVWEEQYKVKLADFIVKEMYKFFFLEEGYTSVVNATAYWNRAEQWFLYGRD